MEQLELKTLNDITVGENIITDINCTEVIIDSKLNTNSKNLVQNKAIQEQLQAIDARIQTLEQQMSI